jgi:hypothetical protein
MAAYRDETETLRARVAELEQEVASLRDATSREGERPWSGSVARVFGAPFSLVEEHVLEAPLDDALLEEILEVLRARLGAVGIVTRTTSKGAVTWQCGPPALQRIVEVTLKPDGARTKLRIVERIGQLAGGLFGGIVGGVGGGVGLGFGVPLMIELHSARLLPFTIPATVLAVWMAVRTGFAGAARRRQRQLGAVAAEIARIAQDRAVPRTRVASESEGERESESESKSKRESESESESKREPKREPRR